METYDAIVIGAGPAGCTLAHNLAAQGLGVALLERAELPRAKVCGGGVPARTRAILSHVDYGAAVLGEVDRVCLHTRWGRDLTVETGVVAEVVDRARFDAILAAAAAEAGAHLQTRCPLTRIARSGNHWRLEAGGHSYRCRIACACDGARSATARYLRLPETDLGLAVEAYAPYPPGRPPSQRRTATFDLTCIRSGYGWLFPRAGEIALGVGTARLPAPRLLLDLDRFVKRHLPGTQTTRDRTRGAFLPAFKTPLPWYARDNLYRVGDAAGLVDPLTGEGLYYAVASAALCAESIAGSGEDDYNARVAASLAAPLMVAARYARRAALAPSWLKSIALTTRRGRRYAELFVELLAGRIDYPELYRTMHGGRNYDPAGRYRGR